MLVKVEQKHINCGTPGDCNNCAIALAVKDATGADIVYSDDFSIEWGNKINGKSNMVGMATPISLQIFMDNYDVGNPVEPFEFILLEEY